MRFSHLKGYASLSPVPVTVPVPVAVVLVPVPVRDRDRDRGRDSDRNIDTDRETNNDKDMVPAEIYADGSDTPRKCVLRGMIPRRKLFMEA
jgi:hypothetical protein